jgi:hypothetical protein
LWFTLAIESFSLVTVVLWEYRTTCKKLIGKTPLRLVYEQEVVVSVEFLVLSLCIAAITNMKERGTLHERLIQLMEMEEDMILAGFHQKYRKQETNPGMTDILRRIFLRRET